MGSDQENILTRNTELSKIGKPRTTGLINIHELATVMDNPPLVFYRRSL